MSDYNPALLIKKLGGALPALLLPDQMVAYQCMSLSIPRCKLCSQIHKDDENVWKQLQKRRVMVSGGIGICLGVACGTLVAFGQRENGFWPIIRAFALGSAIASAFFAPICMGIGKSALQHDDPNGQLPSTASLANNVRPFSAWAEFPKIRQFESSGWIRGTKPEEEYGKQFIQVPMESDEP